MLKARADVGELLVDACALLLLVLAIPDVADEDREAAHAGERHGGRAGGREGQLGCARKRRWGAQRG